MKTARLAGHYFNVLGVAILLWMIAELIFGMPFTLDFSFIFYFWAGIGLLNAANGRRKLATVLLFLAVLFTVGYLISLIWTTEPVRSRGEFRTPGLAAVHAGAFLLLFVPPLVLLLLPATRRWCEEHRDAPPPRYRLSARHFAAYVLLAYVPVGAGVALLKSTHELKPSGFSSSFTYGERRIAVVAAGWMEDEKERIVHVSWMAFGESNSYGSMWDGHISVGNHRIEVPDLKPVKYLGSPPRPASAANVLLVRQVGTVIRLDRRVTPENLESAREAADGVRDFDELRKRLEALLPTTEGTTETAPAASSRPSPSPSFGSTPP